MEEPKDENAEGEENKAPKYESYTEMETLNSMVPIWQRDKKDVTEEEYETFYRDKFFDYNKPLRTIHYNVEGNVSFKALLYIPGKAPYDFYTKDYKRGLQLYSSGVLPNYGQLRSTCCPSISVSSAAWWTVRTCP